MVTIVKCKKILKRILKKIEKLKINLENFVKFKKIKAILINSIMILLVYKTIGIYWSIFIVWNKYYMNLKYKNFNVLNKI